MRSEKPHGIEVPSAMREVIGTRDLIVFDGVCVLCFGFFRLILRFDTDKRFGFATAQSSVGQSFYRAMNLPTDEFETNLVVVNGQVFQHLDAFAAAMGALRGIWRVFALMRYLPRFVKMPIYRVIARNRYALFGKRDQCMIPDAVVRARFVEGGF